jgi:hypothetical protein
MYVEIFVLLSTIFWVSRDQTVDGWIISKKHRTLVDKRQIIVEIFRLFSIWATALMVLAM